jgi:hypothetical protein
VTLGAGGARVLRGWAIPFLGDSEPLGTEDPIPSPARATAAWSAAARPPASRLEPALPRGHPIRPSLLAFATCGRLVEALKKKRRDLRETHTCSPSNRASGVAPCSDCGGSEEKGKQEQLGAQGHTLRGLLLPPEHALRPDGEAALPHLPPGSPRRVEAASAAHFRLPRGAADRAELAGAAIRLSAAPSTTAWRLWPVA